MTVLTAESAPSVAIQNLAIEMTAKGEGRPLLFLHSGHPSGRLDPQAPARASGLRSRARAARTDDDR